MPPPRPACRSRRPSGLRAPPGALGRRPDGGRRSACAPVADPDLGPEWVRTVRRPAGDERRPLELDRRRLEILAATERDGVRQRIDPADVARLARGRRPAPGAGRSCSAATPPCSPTGPAVAIEQRPGLRLPSGALAQRVAIVAARHEADLLALGLVGGRQAERASDLAHLGLGQLAERKPGVLELILAQAVQEVGLVLVRVAGAQQACLAVRTDRRAGRSGRWRPPRSRTDGGPGRAGPRTSRRCCSRRTGTASVRRGRRRGTAGARRHRTHARGSSRRTGRRAGRRPVGHRRPRRASSSSS